MADVFTVLAEDHEEVKGMLAELEKGPTGASEEPLALRKKMAEELIIEETQVWPGLRQHRPPRGGRPRDPAQLTDMSLVRLVW
jgi:hypothetical protein